MQGQPLRNSSIGEISEGETVVLQQGCLFLRRTV